MYLFNGIKIEIKKVQLTKVDRIMMFYKAMCLIFARSYIWGLFGGLRAGSLTFISKHTHLTT